MKEPQQLLAGVHWFDLDDPSSAALDELGRRYGLHELQIEDCRHRPQRAKAEEYQGYLFTIGKHLRHSDAASGELHFDDFDVFLTPECLITVHEGTADFIARVRSHAEQEHITRLDRIFYLIVDAMVDEYVSYLDTLADKISDIEGAVLECPEPPVLRSIFSLKRKLIEFRRVAGGMRDVVNTLMRREHGLLGDDLDPYFRDVYDHIIRTVDLIVTYRDLLTGSLDIYLSAVANRTNEVMKILTIWGTVALPLVIITGFFGMNLPLPWTHSGHAMLYTIGLMALSTALVLLYFRKKKWF